MSTEPNYIKKKNEGDAVTKTKVSHGRIETVIRVRNAKTKKELDLEVQRLNILNEIDKTTTGENITLPPAIKHWQQLIIIVGTLNLKSTTEITLAGKKLGYAGALTRRAVNGVTFGEHKDLFKYSKEKGWQLTNKGQTEFSRLKQFV